MENQVITGKQKTIELKDFTVAYDDVGKGRIPVIFLHGFPFDKSSWLPQIEALKDTHRVIAFDIRGFGQSGAGTGKPEIRLFADDLVQFMDALKINKAIVCGLSMGGYILLNAIFRYANRFEAIVLCDTQCISDTPEIKETRKQTIKQIKANGINSFALGFTKNVFCPETLDKKKELVKKIHKIILSTSFDSITGTLGALSRRKEMCTSLSLIDVPVLILCGKEDVITVPAQSEFLHDNIARSKIHLIKKAGHLSNLEQPAEFNRHLVNFISKIGKDLKE